MTMFAMKPKFNLAEFLSVPASTGAGKYRGARRNGMQAATVAKPDDATQPATPEDPGSTDQNS